MHSGKDPEGCCHPGAEGPGQTPPSPEAYLQMIGWKLDDSCMNLRIQTVFLDQWSHYSGFE